MEDSVDVTQIFGEAFKQQPAARSRFLISSDSLAQQAVTHWRIITCVGKQRPFYASCSLWRTGAHLIGIYLKLCLWQPDKCQKKATCPVWSCWFTHASRKLFLFFASYCYYPCDKVSMFLSPQGHSRRNNVKDLKRDTNDTHSDCIIWHYMEKKNTRLVLPRSPMSGTKWMNGCIEELLSQGTSTCSHFIACNINYSMLKSWSLTFWEMLCSAYCVFTLTVMRRKYPSHC